MKKSKWLYSVMTLGILSMSFSNLITVHAETKSDNNTVSSEQIKQSTQKQLGLDKVEQTFEKVPSRQASEETSTVDSNEQSSTQEEQSVSSNTKSTNISEISTKVSNGSVNESSEETSDPRQVTGSSQKNTQKSSEQPVQQVGIKTKDSTQNYAGYNYLYWHYNEGYSIKESDGLYHIQMVLNDVHENDMPADGIIIIPSLGKFGSSAFIDSVEITDTVFRKLTSITGAKKVRSFIIPATTSCTFTDGTNDETAVNKPLTYLSSLPWSSLNTVCLSGLNFSNVKSVSSMFFRCSNLTEVDMRYTNFSNVEDVSGMFSECSKVKKINMDSVRLSKVTDMHDMFGGCSSLSSLNVSGWNTSQVTDMNYMFDGCSSLSSLNVSGWNTSQVTDMKSMFNGCANLSQLDVSKWNVSNVGKTVKLLSRGSMDDMFNGCSSLLELNLSSWDMTNVQSVDHMFYQCGNLKTIGDVSNWNLKSLKNIDYMFCSCSNLEDLDVSNWKFTPDNITSLANVFYGCSSLCSINLNNWGLSDVYRMSSTFNGCSSIKELDLSKWKWNTQNSGFFSWVFKGCVNLEKVTLGEGWKVSSIEQTFAGCDKLSYLDLSNVQFDTNCKTTDAFKSGNAKPLLISIGQGDTVISHYDFTKDNCFPPVTVTSGEHGAFKTLTDPQYAFSTCITTGSSSTLDFSQKNPEVKAQLAKLEKDLQPNSPEYVFNGWKFTQGAGDTELQKNMNGTYTAQWKSSVLTNQSVLPKELNFGTQDISYHDKYFDGFSDDTQKTPATGKVDMTDTRGTNGEGFNLKVSRTKLVGLNTKQELVSSILFQTKNLNTATGNDIEGNNQTVELAVPNKESMVINATSGKSGGETTMDLSNFQLKIPASSHKTKDTYSGSVTWTLSDAPQ